MKFYKIFLSIGENSGDNLGANLIKNLYKECEIFGIVGPKTSKVANIKSIFPMKDLSIIGYAEIIPKIFKIFFRMLQAVFFIKKNQPDLIITIDSPGFNFILVKILRTFSVKAKFIHYVAPSVWAYKPERAKVCAELFDHIMLIFPFEKKYFEEENIRVDYVGNQFISVNNVSKYSPKSTYKKFDKKIISIFPGSRQNEINNHFKVLKDYINLMKDQYIIFIPSTEEMEDQIKLLFPDALVSSDQKTKNDFIKSSDLLLVKSGTAVLESMNSLIPMIVFYKVSAITGYFIKRKLNVNYVSICNIVQNREIIPELLQENFNLENLRKISFDILHDEKKRNKQISEFQKFFKLLEEKPSNSPESIVRSYIEQTK